LKTLWKVFEKEYAKLSDAEAGFSPSVDTQWKKSNFSLVLQTGSVHVGLPV